MSLNDTGSDISEFSCCNFFYQSMARLVLSDLLNPVDLMPSPPPPLELVNIQQEWDEIEQLTASPDPLLVSPHTQQGLLQALECLKAVSCPITPLPLGAPLAPMPSSSSLTTSLITSPLPATSHSSSPKPTVRHNVYLNCKTTLTTLYTHPLGTCLEYPETLANSSVGHLFKMDPDNWSNPTISFVYSLGRPCRRSKLGADVSCCLIVNKDNQNVPCFERHVTCM